MRNSNYHSNNRIAIIGYGSQGRAVSLNLRDSGYDIVVGLREDSPSIEIAKKDNVPTIATVTEAVSTADVICFAFPDHLHEQVYRKDIKSNLNKNSTLLFLHGLSIHFGFVQPPEYTDVILVAPHAPGDAVREKYTGDRSVSAFYGVYQDSSGHAEQTAIDVAMGFGIQKRWLVRTSFEHEAVGDLFGEQAVLCGGLASLVKNGFDVLVENGIPAENAYLEVAHQLDLIVDLIKKDGIEGMLRRISVAARFGSLYTGPKIINSATRARMQTAFDRIRTGNFTDHLRKMTPKEIDELNEACAEMSDPRFENVIRKYTS
ncbi:MAG: ketol-acid reductoisomerase [candidate division Zixibacteria bacterium]|nr:ketol-acid reductoisomerase [candidate division Zixibacteria bacterium]